MIARLRGTLLELDVGTQTVLVEVDQLGYEVLVPGYALSDLSRLQGREITLHTWAYHEGLGGGTHFVPRLIGFPRAADKAFFQRFISVKGIGIRKALRALARPLGEVAGYIETGDTRLLATLPEIGKRMAEQIVAQLKGKMQEYAAVAAAPGPDREIRSEIEREALEILLQLGERPGEAQELITRARSEFDDLNTTDKLVQAAYKIKGGCKKA